MAKSYYHDPLLDHDQHTNYNFFSLASLRAYHSKSQLKDQSKGVIEYPTKFPLKTRLISYWITYESISYIYIYIYIDPIVRYQDYWS